MNLRQELIEFGMDWYKDNPAVGQRKVERMIDNYLTRKRKSGWEKQVVAELSGCCPHCSATVTFDVPMQDLNFDEHIEVVIGCGNPECQKDFYVYLQAEAHVSNEPLTAS